MSNFEAFNTSLGFIVHAMTSFPATRSGEKVLRRRRRASPGEQELLAKAFEVFVEMGFEGASVEAIASAAGVTKRTLYLRHQDKETLFRAAVEQAIGTFVVPLAQLRDAERENLGDTLLAIGRMLVANILSPDGLRLLHLTNSVAQRMPELAAFNVHRGISTTLAFLTDLLERRLGDGLQFFTSADTAAMAFINLVVGGPATWITQGVLLEQAFIDRYVVESVAMFLHGIQPVPALTMAGSPEAILDENRRLKLLLGDAMLKISSLSGEDDLPDL